MSIPDLKRPLAVVVFCAVLCQFGGCSIQRVASNGLADALSASGSGSFSRDEDIVFLGEAIPFALKMMESASEAAPQHVAIRQALAAGFAQYATVYVAWPAEQQRFDDYDVYQEGQRRARSFYRRAANYAVAAMELSHGGWSRLLDQDADTALTQARPEDVPALFWLAASWLLQLGSTFEEPELMGRFPLAVELMQRCEELAPGWNDGAVNAALISVEPNIPGADPYLRAERRHAQAVAKGPDASADVSLALASALPQQDRERFRELMENALRTAPESNPDTQIATIYAQQRARFYLDHLDDLFL